MWYEIYYMTYELEMQKYARCKINVKNILMMNDEWWKMQNARWHIWKDEKMNDKTGN